MDALRPAGDSPPATFVSRAEKVEVWLSSDLEASDSPIQGADTYHPATSSASPAMSKALMSRGVPSPDDVASQLRVDSAHLQNRFENTLKVLQTFSNSGRSQQQMPLQHDSSVGSALQEVADLRNRVRTLLSPAKPPKSDISDVDVSRHEIDARHGRGSMDTAEHGMPAAAINIPQTKKQKTPLTKSMMDSMRKSTENLLASEDVADLVRNAMLHVRSRIHDFPSTLSRSREMSSQPSKPAPEIQNETSTPREPPVHVSTSTADSPPSQSPSRPPLHPPQVGKQSPHASAVPAVESALKTQGEVQPALPRPKQKPAPTSVKADAKTMRALQIQRGGWSKDISDDDDDILPAGLRSSHKPRTSDGVKPVESVPEPTLRSSARALQTSTCFDVNVTFQPENNTSVPPVSNPAPQGNPHGNITSVSSARSQEPVSAEILQVQDIMASRACVVVAATGNASLGQPAAVSSAGSNIHSLYTSPAGEKESLSDADCSRISASPMRSLDITATHSTSEQHPQSEPIDDVSLVISLLDDPDAFDDMLQPSKKPNKPQTAMLWTPSILVSHAHADQQKVLPAPVAPVQRSSEYIRTAVRGVTHIPAQPVHEASTEYPSSYWDDDEETSAAHESDFHHSSAVAPAEQLRQQKQGVVLDAFEAIRASRELLQEQSFDDSSDLFSISFIDAHMQTHATQPYQPWRPCGSSTGTKLRPRTAPGTSTIRQARPSTAKAKLSTQPTRRR
jgi:hypothetical protein